MFVGALKYSTGLLQCYNQNVSVSSLDGSRSVSTLDLLDVQAPPVTTRTHLRVCVAWFAEDQPIDRAVASTMLNCTRDDSDCWFLSHICGQPFVGPSVGPSLSPLEYRIHLLQFDFSHLLLARSSKHSRTDRRSCHSMAYPMTLSDEYLCAIPYSKVPRALT